MDDLLPQLLERYSFWTQDIQTRITRKNGWNDVMDAYYGVLPEDWPFRMKIVDPRIRTILQEKNSRLLGNRISGRVLPRENGDTIKARIHQAILDYQWDKVSYGGSMQQKLSMADLNTRLYGSQFALVLWRVEKDEEDKIVYEGNDLQLLDIRDCGIDPAAKSIRDAKWFQVRQWVYLEDLEKQLDSKGKPIFRNIDIIRKNLKDKVSDKRNDYTPRVKQIRGLEDRLGMDREFPMIEIVTEYRKDKWITFSPQHSVVLREIENPYNHGDIPVVQLTYHRLDDDPIGESEVEPVIPLWKALQALVSSYIEEVLLKMRPPLKVIRGSAAIETILYSPDALWLVDRPDAITEVVSSGNSIQYFQTTYTSLVSAINSAMGGMSMGISNIDPNANKRTATEVKASVRQQTTVDQKNLVDLSDFIKDFVRMWISNNQQFLFTQEKSYYVQKIIGVENYNVFRKAGFDQTIIPPEVDQQVADIIAQNPDITDFEIEQIREAGRVPKYPVILNPQREKILKKSRLNRN
ncbi:MAG: hypothetical protein KatS3mg101_0946 [Patescibacteria group bacterium]|nr:MAG: hypothetical protein KatS3mg101_0946 [Patescibacteria group bacterium]